jgi:hypothetical protein
MDWRVAKSKGLELLKNLRMEIPRLRAMPLLSPAFLMWRDNAAATLDAVFGRGSCTDRFDAIAYVPPALAGPKPEASRQQVFVEGLDQAAALLDACILELELQWPEDLPPPNWPSPSPRLRV